MCLMVQRGVSEQRGYATDGGLTVENGFATKPVSEQVEERENVINKLHFILQSLNIHITRYETELDNLNFTVSNFSDSLKGTRLSNTNLTGQIRRVTNKS